MILNIISKYPNGASFDASANFKDKIKNKCPTEATKPTIDSKNHCLGSGITQTTGTIIEAITHPTTPVIKRVNKGIYKEIGVFKISQQTKDKLIFQHPWAILPTVMDLTQGKL